MTTQTKIISPTRLTQREQEFQQVPSTLSPEKGGYIRCSQRHTRYFEHETGAPFIPIGLNICFPRFSTSVADGIGTMQRWLNRFAENGGNYVRVYLGHPLFDIERLHMGQFEEEQAANVDLILTHAWSLGIRLKLVINHFRSIEEIPQIEVFPGAVNFSKPNYHVKGGGLFYNMEEYLTSPEGRQHFLRKLDWLAERYQEHPGILGWDLWNEMNALGGESWKEWTHVMLPELKRRFPHHLAMQNLGSLDGAAGCRDYEEIIPLESNEVAQVHRYLDLGASWPICHGSIDVMMADAVTNLRQMAPQKPVLLAESGAVEPHHARPWDQYPRDTEGMILHDILFAPFFAGSVGSGNAWHWHEYVDRNNLWWHFQRFSRAIEGINPIEEGFTPCRSDTSDLRVYILQGKNTSLIWCRDAASDWQTELMEGHPPSPLCHQCITLPFSVDSELSRYSISFYDPWMDRSTPEIPCLSEVISLPSFRRSLVLRLTRQKNPPF